MALRVRAVSPSSRKSVPRPSMGHLLTADTRVIVWDQEAEAHLSSLSKSSAQPSVSSTPQVSTGQRWPYQGLTTEVITRDHTPQPKGLLLHWSVPLWEDQSSGEL